MSRYVTVFIASLIVLGCVDTQRSPVAPALMKSPLYPSDGVMQSTYAYKIPFPPDATIAFGGMGSYSFHGQVWFCVNTKNCFLIFREAFNHAERAQAEQKLRVLKEYSESL